MKHAKVAGEVPPSHETKKLHLAGISPDLLTKVLQVFVDMTEPSLLNRCMRKETQNSLYNQVSPCVEVQSASNEKDIYNIIDYLQMTADTDVESLQQAFSKNSKHHIPEEIFDLFKQFRMWRMGPGGDW